MLKFSPWGQAFLSERLDSAPPGLGEALIVTMYLNDETRTPKALFRFKYHPRSEGGAIYLPGPGDPYYDLNKSTILSGGDGHWFEASSEWDALYRSLVPIRPPSTGSAGLR